MSRSSDTYDPSSASDTAVIPGELPLHADVGLVTPEAPGRYTDEELELGRGATGRVVLVRDAHLGREIARKELLTPRSDLVARFVTEARITARLEHPNIVPVYELGRSADGTLYYTMRRVRGTTLRQALADRADPTARLGLLPAFTAACQAVAYAHANGVVHRDLKPDNIAVGAFGETQVLDWGIAKVLADAEIEGGADLGGGAGETRVGTTLGTPAYMSPEQARGAAVDARADVWGLGAILFEILAGRPPITGSTRDVLARARTGAVDDVGARAPRAPRELVAIVRRALRADAADRYPTAQALAADVAAFLQGAVVSAHAYSRRERLTRWVAARRQAVAVAGVMALALVVTAGAGIVNVVRERNAAVEALRDSVVRMGTERWEDGADGEALAIAAGALALGEDPAARGLLVAARSGWLPTLVEEGPAGTQCFATVFSADGERACRGPGAVWRWRPGGPVRSTSDRIPEPIPGSFGFLGDGRTLGVGRGDGLAVWGEGEPILVRSGFFGLFGPEGEGARMARYAPGRDRVDLVHVAADGSVSDVIPTDLDPTAVHPGVDGELWITNEGKLLRFAGGALAPAGVAIDAYALAVPDAGTPIYAGGELDGGLSDIAVWERGTTDVRYWPGPGGDLRGIAVSGEGRWIAAVAEQGANGVWDREGRLLGRVPSAARVLRDVSFSPDGLLALAGASGRVRLWRLPDAPPRWWNHVGTAFDVAVIGDDTAFSTGDDARLVRFSRAGRSPPRDVVLSEAPLGALLPRAGVLWVGDDAGTVHAVDPDSLARVGGVQVCDTLLGRMEASPDDRTVAITCHTGQVFTLAGGPQVSAASAVLEDRIPLDGIAWSPDGARLEVLGRMAVTGYVLDGATLGVLETFSTGSCGPGRGLAILPDGRRVVSGDAGVCVAGRSAPLDDPTRAVRTSLRVSHDGRWLAAASLGGNLALYRVPELTLAALVPVRAQAPWVVRFGDDDRSLYVPGTAGAIEALDLTALDLDAAGAGAEARRRVGMALDRAEVVEVAQEP